MTCNVTYDAATGSAKVAVTAAELERMGRMYFGPATQIHWSAEDACIWHAFLRGGKAGDRIHVSVVKAESGDVIMSFDTELRQPNN